MKFQVICIFFVFLRLPFTLAFRAYSELGKAGKRLNHRGTQTAELGRLLSTKGEMDFRGNNEVYDFCRRASVAARISMCVATGLSLKAWAHNQRNIEPDFELQPEGDAFSLDDEHQDDFIARFDQMFPHHLIREKLKDQNNFPLTRKIMIFRLKSNIAVNIIEMNIRIDIKKVTNFKKMKCSISTSAINSALPCRASEDGPWYRHLQCICFEPANRVRLPCVKDDWDTDPSGDTDSEDSSH